MCVFVKRGSKKYDTRPQTIHIKRMEILQNDQPHISIKFLYSKKIPQKNPPNHGNPSKIPPKKNGSHLMTFAVPPFAVPKKITTATSAGESAAWFRTQNSQGVWAGKGICMSSVYSYVKCEIYIVKICIHDISCVCIMYIY